VVASIGRKPLKVLVQVNTSGEECKLIMFSDFVTLLGFSVFFFWLPAAYDKFDLIANMVA
jgi:hypothetical protein